MRFTVRYGGSETIRVTAVAAHVPGDVVVYGGFVGVYTGTINCAVGDVIDVALNVAGEAVTASGVTFAAGAAVFWDTVNRTCVASAGANIVMLGTAIIAKTSGQLVTHVLCNRRPIA